MRPKFLLIVAAAVALVVAAASWALSWPPRSPLLTPHAHRAACPPPLLGAAATDIVVYIPSPIPWRARRQQVLRTMRPDLLDGNGGPMQVPVKFIQREKRGFRRRA